MTKLFVLPLGRCGNDKEKIFTPGKDQGAWIDVPVWATLIMADGLNVLVDTGMHPIHIQQPSATFGGTPYENYITPVLKEGETLEDRLAEVGLRPKDIDIVVNTHLHFDHAGGNYLFPHSSFFVQQEHYMYALSNPGAFPPKYFLLPELTYDTIDGEIELIPNVRVIRSPGHVPGMQAVIVDLPKTGTIILAGDAISLREHLTDDIWEGYWNPKLARASARRMNSIVKSKGGQIFFGHDPVWWQDIKTSPAYYD